MGRNPLFSAGRNKHSLQLQHGRGTSLTRFLWSVPRRRSCCAGSRGRTRRAATGRRTVRTLWQGCPQRTLRRRAER